MTTFGGYLAKSYIALPHFFCFVYVSKACVNNYCARLNHEGCDKPTPLGFTHGLPQNIFELFQALLGDG